MAKHTYYIKGMHCASCEVLIEKELLAISGVTFVNASLSQNLVNIEYDKEKPEIKELNEKFKKHGYVFFEHAFEEKNKGGIWGILIIALLVIAGFLVITKLGLSSFININSESSLPAFFVFGLIAGLSSCAALIGGLVLSFSKQWVEGYGKSGSLIDKSKPHFLFNIGRLISFSLLGLALGFLGEKFKISSAITSVFILFVSAVMLVLALQMIGVKILNRFKFVLPKRLSGGLIKDRQFRPITPFIIGFLTFLLPCGFTVVAEGFAILSGNPIKGFLIMLLFALGTTLPLLIIGFSSTKLLSSQHLSEKFLKVAGILIIFFVDYNINFQFGISRYISENWKAEGSIGNSKSKISETPNQIKPPAQNVQIVKAVYTESADIQPNSFEVKKGQPVRFEVEVRDNGYGCMSTIMIPGLWNQPLTLKKGQILVMEFTPNRTGSYKITCAMGVPRGSLKVID
jgi:sulfite exporter TauE/SafE/copper chaperone CopZ